MAREWAESEFTEIETSTQEDAEMRILCSRRIARELILSGGLRATTQKQSISTYTIPDKPIA
jgi:hypothetical protein